VARRAELAAGHEHDVLEPRQRLDLGAVEKIGGDAVDAGGVERLARVRLAEPGDADDALARRRALGEPRQRRPDLAGDAQDDDVAGKLAQL
jgi:hypothetical protein